MDRALGVFLAALRRRVRSMGARVFVGALVLALTSAVLLPSEGTAGGAVVLEGALVVIGIGAGLAAAASAGALPEDRGSGVHAWLAATACPKSVLRAAPAVAGIAVTVVVTLCSSLVAGAAMAATGLEVPTHRTTPLEYRELPPAPAETRIQTEVIRPEGSGASSVPVEIEFRPRFRSPEAANIGSIPLRTQGFAASSPDGGPHEPEPIVAVRGRSILELPGTPHWLLASADPRVDVRVVSARAILGPASFFANVLRAGLLLGLALASIVPIAVLLSRYLSASSAVTAALVLAGVGVLHGPLLTLAADAQGLEGASIASAVLHGATWLAPDLSVVSGASEALVGHVVSRSAFAGLVAPALHASVAFLLLAFLPARRVDA